MFTSTTMEKELEANTLSALPYFVYGGPMIVVFVVLSCLSFDWVRSKPVLGILGIISAVMATAAAFGVLIYCGLTFITINVAIPFLMLGKYHIPIL